MIDIKTLSKELKKLPDDYIILVETSSDNIFEVTLAIVKLLTNKNDHGIIVSANRPYINLLNTYKRSNINTSKLFVVDLLSKNQNADKDVDNVIFIENPSSLTDISLSINKLIKKLNNRKFIFFDSLTTMLIHNEPYVFARFIHSILTRMRLNNVGGVMVSITDTANKEIRSEIAQLCDKVIKIT